MKIVALVIFIHIFAYSMARAEETTFSASVSNSAIGSVSNEISISGAEPSVAKLDECKVLLPQVESDFQELEARYKSISNGIPVAQESYLISFNQMTEVLFQVTQTREEETQKISQSRDQLKASLQKFNERKTEEAANDLQDSYMDLTVRLYSSLIDSQKTLDGLKNQLSHVEATRSQFANSRKELEDLDHQKLAIEAKLISLKIKCQPQKRY